MQQQNKLIHVSYVGSEKMLKTFLFKLKNCKWYL